MKKHVGRDSHQPKRIISAVKCLSFCFLVAPLSASASTTTTVTDSETSTLICNKLTPGVSPVPRCCGAFAFDPVSNTTLLFGGQVPVVPGVSYTAVNDAWQFQNGQWAAANTGPTARFGAAMVYDPSIDEIVLFGGSTGTADLNETWLWDGSTGTWAEVSPSTLPPGRRFDSKGMAYDPNTKTIVMFGGITFDNSTFFDDTWVWNGATRTWTQMNPASSPSARRTVLATDPSGNVMLFGGTGPAGNLNDTWVWNGTTWVQQAPADSPSARDLHNMVLDPDVNQVVMFAGYNVEDTWTWNGCNWVQMNLTTGIPERYAFGMDYDAAAHAIVIFGGYNFFNGIPGPAMNDTWELTPIP